MSDETVVLGPDGQPRCKWCSGSDLFWDYHDKEWGFPVKEDQRLFEKLCLESFQSGLSWLTILKKRDSFRTAFENFDFHKVALFTEEDVRRLLENSDIIRHRGKIEAVINNAQKAIDLVAFEGSLAHYFWKHEPKERSDIEPMSISFSDVSTRISKDLKKKGWKFVGPTTIYSFMQAMGLINDHAHDCVLRSKIDMARSDFIRP